MTLVRLYVPPQVYKGIVELCMIKYRDSEGLYVGLPEAAFCTARSQLLMNLHDAGIAEISSQVLDYYNSELVVSPSRSHYRRACPTLLQWFDVAAEGQNIHAIIMMRSGCGHPQPRCAPGRDANSRGSRAVCLRALHVVESPTQDPVHKLAWTLDACINDRSLDSRRLRELQNFFAPHDTAGAMPPPATARTAKRHKHKCGYDGLGTLSSTLKSNPYY